MRKLIFVFVLSVFTHYHTYSQTIACKTFLQGAYQSGSLMSTSLTNIMPGIQPYNSDPWNYSGTESLNFVPLNMVDWVLIELRNSVDPTIIVSRRAALLLVNGEIVDTNMTLSVNFPNISPGDYYLCIYHRNHFPVMSASTISLPNTVPYDFSDTLNFPPYGGGSKALVELESGVFGMIAGDVNMDGAIKYSGPANDRGPVLQYIVNQSGSTSITTTVSAYSVEDINMDSIIKYSGPGNDPSLIIQNLVVLTGSTSITSVYNSIVPIGITSFQCGDTLVDTRDSNSYSTVLIGNQCWMRENLAYLPSVSPSGAGSYSLPYYYVYDYQGTSVTAAKATSWYQTYGVLYNWPAAMDGALSSNSVPSSVQGICPTGWHLPGDEEWKILEGEVDSQYGYPDPSWDGIGWRGTDAGGNLKETGTTNWNSANAGATNSSDFTALPGGGRFYNGSFSNSGSYAYFWSSTEYSSAFALYRMLYNSNADVYRSYYDRIDGFSVRCLKDAIPCSPQPDQSDAGPDTTDVCSPYTLDANTAINGNGTWSIIAGAGGIINDIYSPNSAFSGSPGSTYTLRWSIGTVCDTSWDDVSISFEYLPTIADAGLDSFGACSPYFLTANSSSGGDGEWSIISGIGGNINDIQNPNSSFSGISGSSYVLQWSIGTVCDTSMDHVNIVFATPPTLAEAGLDTSGVCSPYMLTANSTISGEGSWSIVSGTGGSINDIYNPNSTFSGISGTNYILRWSISTACDTSWDDVNVAFLAYPTIADAGTDSLNIVGDSIVLMASIAVNGQGSWSILSGSGGIIADTTNPGSTFYGIATNTYELIWTINNGCESSSDTVIINFAAAWLGCGNPLTDTRDGNTYNTVLIGPQCWMSENLAFLPSIGPSILSLSTSPNYYVYDYQGSTVSGAKATNNYQTYGVLYNWYAAMGGEASSNNVPSGVEGVCPSGWRLPSDEEWKVLSGEVDNYYGYPDPIWDYYAGGVDVGGNLKETGTTHWLVPNTAATNSSGFTALPGGVFANGDFSQIGQDAAFWSSTEADSDNAMIRVLYYWAAEIYRFNNSKNNGNSVRCLKDTIPCSPPPTQADAGPDSLNIIGDSIALMANIAVNGQGLWTIINGSGGSFADSTNPTSIFYGLPGDSYYLRWTISSGSCSTSDNTVISFASGTPCPGLPTFSYGGQTYNTVQIGTQCWMKENINIGSRIDGSNNQTDNGSIEKYCYDNQESNCNTYGGLYQWDEVMQYATTAGSQGICPGGWHVPADNEWKVLEGTVDSEYGVGDPEWDKEQWRGSDASRNLRSKTGWNLAHNGNDLFGFAGLPGGLFNDMAFFSVLDEARFWSSTENNSNYGSWIREMNISNYGHVGRSTNDKNIGVSVRCIKDCLSPPTQANAGPDNLNIIGDSIALMANTAVNGQGSWSVISGPGGSFADSANPTTTFYGVQGKTYLLLWQITSNCDISSDVVQISFDIPAPHPCLNIPQFYYGSQIYNTVQIGSQCWMKENLNIGTMINGLDTMQNNAIIEKYCYNDDTVNCDTYGGLYMWEEMMQYNSGTVQQGICPTDWHIPSDEEWKVLEGTVDSLYGIGYPQWSYSGMRGSNAGFNLKSTQGWNSGGSGSDSYGFSALSSGYRNNDGSFYRKGRSTYFWASTDGNNSTARTRGLHHDENGVRRGSLDIAYGFSVRCLMDTCSILPTQADAGQDTANVCLPLSLFANAPVNGTGFWSIISGNGGNVADPSSFESSFNGIPGTTYTLRWTISNPCGSTSDDVIISFATSTTIAYAGPDQNNVCSPAALAANTPVYGTGLWSIISGVGGTIIIPSSPVSTFIGTPGKTYILRWTISNACGNSYDDVVIKFTQPTTIASAGPDQNNVCSPDTLAANTPVYGTGMWSIISGAGGNITTPSNPVSPFNGAPGITYTLRWTISNVCDSSYDDVIISFEPPPTNANAGTDQLNISGTSTQLTGNTPIYGIGNWSVNSGTGGLITSPTNPISSFSGTAGNTYKLSWKISTSCGSSTDTVIINFATPVPSCGTPIIDNRDGNTYNTVQIGEQCWLAENLSYLPYVNSPTTGAAPTPLYYVYDYYGTNVAAAKATSNYSTYGVLYNWAAAMAGEASSNSVPSGVQGICPTGWHLPSDEEWKILEGEVDGQYGYPDYEWNEISFRGTDVGGNLKETGTTHWYSPNTGATNSSGFTALPGGSITYNFGGMFEYKEVFARFLSCEEIMCTPSTNGSNFVWFREIYWDKSEVSRRGDHQLRVGSIRCIRDPNNCSPQPTQSNAGTDQLNLSGISAQLAGNTPIIGSGNWTIISGVGGSNVSPSNPMSQFSGLAGNTYKLRWTISNNNCYSSDIVLISFAPGTNCGSPILDTRDGQIYNTITIGSQCWMKENLNIGTMINSWVDQADNGIIEKYCYYSDPIDCNTYGGLYQWDEVMQYVTTSGAQGVCPTGWHIPSSTEWNVLIDYLGVVFAGSKVKETGTTHWTSPNCGATNSSGFTALPGGYFGTNGGAPPGGTAALWSSTEYNIDIVMAQRLINGWTHFNPLAPRKLDALSARCIKD